MTALRAIPGGNSKPKPDKGDLYRRALVRTLGEWESMPGDEILANRIIFYGVRHCNHSDYDEHDFEDVDARLYLIQMLKDMIGALSPAQLIKIFPITKDFKGHKYEAKDYFYTVTKLRKHGLNRPIGDQAFNILWDYINWDITEFMVHYLSAMSDMRRLMGKKGVMEQFCENNGITPHYMATDNKGRMFLTDGKTGETKRVYKKRPRYLRVVPCR